MSNLSCSSSNLSRDSVTEDLWVLEGGLRISGLYTAVFLIIFVLIGVPANVFIIASVIKHKLYRQPAFTPLLNLSLTDLLMCVLMLPLTIVSGVAGDFPLGSSDYIRCQVCQSGIAILILLYVSIYSVMLISVDRFIFIKYPLRYEKLVTVKRMFVAVFLTWLVCVGVSILPVFGFGRMYFSPFIATCIINFTESEPFLILLVILALVPISVLLLTDMWILCIVQRHLRQIYVLYRSCSDDAQKQQLARELNRKIKSAHNRKQLNSVRVFGAIFFANVFTWLPVIGLSFASVVVGIDGVPANYTACAYVMLMSQFVLHPIVMISLVSEVYRPILKMCRRKNSAGLAVELGRNRNEGGSAGLTVELDATLQDCKLRGTRLSSCVCGCGVIFACSAAVLADTGHQKK